MILPYRSPGWKTRPVSPTCEVMGGTEQQPAPCGKAAEYAYPFPPGGWMSLCREHGGNLIHPKTFNIEEVIASGEKFEGALTGRIILARCECGSILSEEDLRTGYRNAATNRPICEGCWDHACDENV